jgi:hypothetical protein
MTPHSYMFWFLCAGEVNNKNDDERTNKPGLPKLVSTLTGRSFGNGRLIK